MMKYCNRIGAAFFLLAVILGTDATGGDLRNTIHPQPNILIIVADDMGYSDLGAYGGEIPTPNLDQLAREGLQFTQFHVTPNCAPTRAALLSGMDPHKAGLGTMAEVMSPNQEGRPGYKGHLNNRVVTVAEVLSTTAGYLPIWSANGIWAQRNRRCIRMPGALKKPLPCWQAVQVTGQTISR